MISNHILEKHKRKMEMIENQEELLYEVLQTYLQLFPVKDAYLLRYSPMGYLAEGIISIHSSDLIHIGDIRDNVRSFPLIYTAIQERKAKYSTAFEFFKLASTKYSIPSTINSLLVVPICFASVTIGYICSSYITNLNKMDDKMLSSLTQFGHMIGEVINYSMHHIEVPKLSRREAEVMQRISLGDSTKEVADYLGISMSTVKQYVQTAVEKLGARNRTHAIGILLRQGFIS